MSNARLAAAWIMAALATTVHGAAAAPTILHLTFEGSHVEDTGLPAGIRHEGPFTASAPLCPAGHARDAKDVVVEPLTVLREFTCDDGSGSFTAFMPGIASEHGGSGTWKIVGGTGKYVSLRGLGTYRSVVLSGASQDFLSITYRATWTGVVDFDTTAPLVRITASTVKVPKPRGAFSLRATVGLGGEAAGSRVSYAIDVTGVPLELLTKLGSSTTGRAIVRALIRPTARTRRVRIRITATDAVGNTATAARVVGLAGR